MSSPVRREANKRPVRQAVGQVQSIDQARLKSHFEFGPKIHERALMVIILAVSRLARIHMRGLSPRQPQAGLTWPFRAFVPTWAR